jgi:diacylglycerol kinase family enzyme
VNTSAGTASSRLASWLAAELPKAAVIETDAGQDLLAQLRLAAAGARILGVAGGDGTVRAASAIALETGLPLLGELGLGEMVDDAVEVNLGAGRRRRWRSRAGQRR